MRTYALPSATLVFGLELGSSFGGIQGLNFKLCPTLPLSRHSDKWLFKGGGIRKDFV